MHLGFDVEEWDKLPWWQQEMYGGRLQEWMRLQDPEGRGRPDEDPEDSTVANDLKLAQSGFKIQQA